MTNVFKVGDIVREGSFVSSIKKIENGKATLTKNYDANVERLSQVEINGSFDQYIVLDCVNPIRASYISPGGQTPMRKSIHYLDSSIDGISIISIIKENGFTIVSELQDWLSQNSPDYYLRTKLGI